MYASPHKQCANTYSYYVVSALIFNQKVSLPSPYVFSQLPLLFSPSNKQRMILDDIMSMKPKALCVCAVEFSHDISNWKVQGHPYVLTFTCLVILSCTAGSVRVVIHLPQNPRSCCLLNTWLDGVLQESRNGKSPGLFCVLKILNCA